ncbi:MAG: RDD family protein [Chloroflexota bacterium]|nr:RDD family protein [Chloroflexota bacterium]
MSGRPVIPVVVLGDVEGGERRRLEEMTRQVAASYGLEGAVLLSVERDRDGVRAVRTPAGIVLLQVPEASPRAVLEAVRQAAMGGPSPRRDGGPAAVVDGSSLARSWAEGGGPARLDAITRTLRALEGWGLERSQVMVVVDEPLREEIDDLPGFLALERGGLLVMAPTAEEAWQVALAAAAGGARLVTGRDPARDAGEHPWLLEQGRVLRPCPDGGELLLAPALPPQPVAMAPAGMGRRVAAYLVDALLGWAVALGVQFLVAVAVLALSGPADAEGAGRQADVAMAIGLPVGAVASFLYRPLCEGSRWQATVGKRLLGLRVARADGGDLNFWQALLRQLARLACELTLGIGYLVALWTRRRQGLHDIIAGTVVVRRQGR